MSELDRNPSPPPEILNDEDLLPDRIGDTVYSKQWIIKTLMKLVEACDKMKEDSFKNSEDSSSPELNNVEETINNGCSIVELDPKLEEDACALWDMTASQEVGKYLIDSGFCGIFQDIIDKTQSPRLLEIVIGILGNISTFDTLCSSILENKSLVLQILLLSGTTDTPTLIQVFRFIVNGLKNQNSQKVLFDAFEENTFFFENVKDILSYSLSSPVILATFELLDTIFMQNIFHTEIWGQDQYLESALVAGKQLLKNEECMDKFFCVFNSLCQCSSNVEKFIKKWNEIKPLFHEYIHNLGKEECLFDTARAVFVHSYFDAYNSLLNTGQMEKTSILSDLGFLSSVAKISCAVDVLISNVKKNNKTTDLQQPETKEQGYFLRHVEEQNGIESTTMLSQHDFDIWNALAESIIDTAKTLQNFVDKEDEKKVISDILNSCISVQNGDSLIV